MEIKELMEQFANLEGQIAHLKVEKPKVYETMCAQLTEELDKIASAL